MNLRISLPAGLASAAALALATFKGATLTGGTLRLEIPAKSVIVLSEVQ
ncbi:MAG TPA: hypothetical protein VM146_19220 [Steroidobacteraceae bacterium]|nr:hypothetical protein [Steroidobacteraceae bacterium]